ncbi:MAG TPA: TolC family protein [Cyclobacteriaceae bacterium]|nr:TolC family protein [Cyclobacteriaceae bacterium]
MKTNPIIFPLVLLLSVVFSAARAQGVLQAYIEEGLRSNLQLQQEQLNYEKSVEGLNIARSLFLPQIALNANFTLANGGRKIDLPVGDMLNPVYATLNKLTDSNQFPTIRNESIQFLPNGFHDTKVRVIQPLFNPDIYFNFKAQKELITIQQAQKNAYENELKYSITAAYYQYLQTEEALKVLMETRGFLTELVKVNQKLVANQKATKDVVLGAEYELNKIDQQLAEAAKNHEVSKSYFNFLLNRDLTASVIVDSTLVSGGSQTESIEQLRLLALSQRQEIKQLQGGLTASERIVELNRASSMLPKINVVGDIGYQGFEYKFDNSQQYAMVVFSLSWDIFKGGEKKAKTQQARLDYQVAGNKMEQLRRQIELQVIQSHYDRQASEQAWITAQAGVKSAEKNFQIIRSKYNEGQAILLEYLDAQNKYTTSKLTQSLRLFDLLRAEAALQKTIASI